MGTVYLCLGIYDDDDDDDDGRHDGVLCPPLLQESYIHSSPDTPNPIMITYLAGTMPDAGALHVGDRSVTKCRMCDVDEEEGQEGREVVVNFHLDLPVFGPHTHHLHVHT